MLNIIQAMKDVVLYLIELFRGYAKLILIVICHFN